MNFTIILCLSMSRFLLLTQFTLGVSANKTFLNPCCALQSPEQGKYTFTHFTWIFLSFHTIFLLVLMSIIKKGAHLKVENFVSNFVRICVATIFELFLISLTWNQLLFNTSSSPILTSFHVPFTFFLNPEKPIQGKSSNFSLDFYCLIVNKVTKFEQ